ncbi:hypothetical protein [Hyphomonas sp.]|uniref:hypothetical protein n=1 Tax=Hyphomonas sp. TaxID=87 RepID=UPI000C5C89EF|nr:hypothetical protein [Hyphomonas sp.]MAB12033.1 hypothetical protein [Hyphomonas sp.]MAU67066.1 hypothetical protein [Hyphomonas sp.]MBM57188.1 hypothetical protein [Hyphomonas sp.]
MKIRKTLKLATMASLAVMTLAACSDTTISSPGAPSTPISPPPPPPPPPPAAATIELVPTAGCPDGTSEATFDAIAADGFSDVNVCVLGGTGTSTVLTTDVTIPANTTIALRGPVFVGEDNRDDAGTPVTLTIGEGVRFFGASASGTSTATDDYLVVTRGSKIEAVGTAANPIRFTSRAKMNDEETGSSITEVTTNAQWGGLVINGFAPINACSGLTGGSADCQKSGEGSSGFFGGDQPDDNSGTLQYVSVEYAGAQLTTEDELNGIAFQGVGSGTVVDHIQVHNNLDDAVEWFGGTVNVKYLVATGAGDDSIDWTDGWSGKLQFAVVNSNIPTSGDPNGIEADNLNNAFDATPFSDPSISNVTMVGSEGNLYGALLRRGTKGTLVNFIVTGFPTGLDIDTDQTFLNLDSGDLTLESWLLDNTVNFENSDGDTPISFPASANIRTANNTLVDGFFPGQQELNVPVSTALSGDTFFTTTNYIGAFSPTETVSDNWASFAQPGTLFPEVDVNCPAGTTENGTLDGKKLCQITGTVASNVRLTNGDALIYELIGSVFVGVDLGPDPAAPRTNSVAANLTIDPGVTVVGEGNDDYLVIARGSKLLSNGTATKPVVFTAKDKVAGTGTFDQDTKGIWGGVIINGRAPINACGGSGTGGTVDCEKPGEGSSGFFGGGTADDDSGQIFYTRVEYAGVQLTTEDELNGIAFQGVGSGTEVDYVQVYNNQDDCFEWFGGTVSAKHMLAIGCGDDQFDWTDGWVGSLQYGIAYSGVGSATGNITDNSNGIEGDNLENDELATPISTPRVSNLTIIAGGDATSQIGVKLRRGMNGTIANLIVLGWPQFGLDVDTDTTIANANAGTLNLQSMFLADNGAPFASDAGGEPDVFSNPAANNLVTNQSATMSGFTFRAGRPGVVPGDNENAVPVFDVTGIGELEPTTYIGAVEDADDTWYLGWSIDQAGNLTSAN